MRRTSRQCTPHQLKQLVTKHMHRQPTQRNTQQRTGLHITTPEINAMHKTAMHRDNTAAWDSSPNGNHTPPHSRFSPFGVHNMSVIKPRELTPGLSRNQTLVGRVRLLETMARGRAECTELHLVVGNGLSGALYIDAWRDHARRLSQRTQAGNVLKVTNVVGS